jgi:hypothetical protein
MLAFLPVEAPSAGTDYTQIFVTLIVTSGVIVTAVFGYLANRAGKAAKVAAEQTQEANSSDHGRVAGVLGELRREMREGFENVAEQFEHIDGRLHDLGKRQVNLTDQSVAHLQWHIDHPPREQNP